MCSTVRQTLCNLNTLFAAFGLPALSGLMGVPPNGYSRFVIDPKVRDSAGRDASCQPLQSTGCHENSLDLQLPGSRLAP
jgi:hypothetical protein